MYIRCYRSLGKPFDFTTQNQTNTWTIAVRLCYTLISLMTLRIVGLVPYLKFYNIISRLSDQPHPVRRPIRLGHL
jgi:hypothetical protein